MGDLDESEEIGSHPEPAGRYFVRFGTFFLAMERPRTDLTNLRDSLQKALDDDPRVASVTADPLRVAWSSQSKMYPPSEKIDTFELITGADGVIAPHFPDPLRFRIHVPIKNQPLFRDEADVPSDNYWVVWDGLTVVLGWERGEEERVPPRSGGQIVVEILEQAAISAGARLVVQACSPGCKNLFAHRVLSVVQYPGTDRAIGYVKRGFPVVATHVHVDGGPEELVMRVWEDLSRSSEAFAQYKNVGRRILTPEQRSRALVAELLARDMVEAEAQARNVIWRGGRAIGNGAIGIALVSTDLDRDANS
ncbi:hypothetical protein [Microbacterium sp. NPDC087589]|uniref:hypothetical protein n=1 Tax=Microbacterium sp. NPDC087589 TaxID=3364191 RepID=UPI00380D6F96